MLGVILKLAVFTNPLFISADAESNSDVSSDKTLFSTKVDLGIVSQLESPVWRWYEQSSSFLLGSLAAKQASTQHPCPSAPVADGAYIGEKESLYLEGCSPCFAPLPATK